MKKLKEIKNKNIIVVGAGISGLGASQLACYLGANVTLTDINKVSIKKNNNPFSKGVLGGPIIIARAFKIFSSSNCIYIPRDSNPIL